MWARVSRPRIFYSRLALKAIAASNVTSLHVTHNNNNNPDPDGQMSEYWKSTPSYWCKFCSQYVRDTSLERKNHDASVRHQNNISRSLRELHKGKERETREQQRAKDEVARLNGLFSDKSGTARDASKPAGSMPRPAPAPAPANMNAAAQRKAHAEQLAAMGVALPEDLQKQVTGVGNYHVVSERVVEPSNAGVTTVNRSLAEILAEAKREPSEVKEEEEEGEELTTASKRKHEHDGEEEEEEGAPKRKAWGSDFKTYPGVKDTADDDVDLDALLNGVARKMEPAVKAEDEGSIVKKEEDTTLEQPLNNVPNVGDSDVKSEPAPQAAPAVVFKKRKGKK